MDPIVSKAIEELARKAATAPGGCLFIRYGEHAVLVPLREGEDTLFSPDEIDSVGFATHEEEMRWIQQTCGLAVAACLSPAQLAAARAMAEGIAR